MCSSASDIAFTLRRSHVVSSSTHETTLLGDCVSSSSSRCCTETDGSSSSKVRESGGRTALCGSRGMSRATHTCAFCSSERAAVFNNGDSRRKSFSRFEREKAETKDGNIIAAHWSCPWRERTDAADHQCSATAGESLFTSPTVLWVLSPFLYLNELTKLRLVSKKINCQCLSPRVIRWMMSNSVAMVFPAQWEPLPQPHPSPQETRSTSSGKRRQEQQRHQEEETQQRKSYAEGEQQQVREPEAENGEQHQQHQRHLHQREVQQMQEEQQKITEGRENRQQREQGKQQYTWRCAVDGVRDHSQELHAEQHQSLRPYGTETQQRRLGHLSADSPLTGVSVSTSSCSPDAVRGLLSAVAAGGSEMSVHPAGGADDVTALLEDSIRSSGNSAAFSASPAGVVARSLAASVSEMATPTGESAYKGEEELSSTVRGVRRRLKGGEAAEASTASGIAGIDRRARLGRSASRCKPLRRFNFLRSLLLRHPAAYGCAPLQLRQLTLHMPESPDVVLSLQQFQTFKTLLEVCSPTLEELHLYDFCSFYAVVDVSPAFSGVGVAGHPCSAAVAQGLSVAERRELRRALKTVELAYISVFDPSGIVNALAVAEDDEVDAAGGAAVGQPADTAPAGDSASAARQQLDTSSPTQKWKLTLSFKMWAACRHAMEEDSVDEDERQGWGPVDQGEGGDSETPSSIGDADNTGSCFWTVNSYAATVPSAVSVPFFPAAGSSSTYEPPGLISDLATTVESAANCFSLGCSTGVGTVSASSLRLTEPQGETSKCNVAVALATEASSAAGGAPDERPIDLADDSAAAAAAKDMTSLNQRDITGGGKSIENNAHPEFPHTSSGSPGEVYTSASRLSDDGSSGSFSESASSTAVPTCETAAEHRKVFHKEGQSSSRGVQSEFATTPTEIDVYHFLHETVSSLQLRCCFPQLRHLQIYGSSDWKTARPYYSCLACLLLPRDRDIHMHNDGQSPRSGNGGSGANNEDGSNSSHSSQRSDVESEDSRNSSEACSSRRCSSAQGQDRGTHRIACTRRSNSQQSRNGNSTSQSGSCRGRRQSSSTHERRHCEQSSSACRVDSPRESQRRSRVFQIDHVGTRLSEVMSGAIPDHLAASDDVKSRRTESTATAKGEGEKVTARHEDLAFPALEELHWQDASCVGEDMLAFLLASKSERLRKLSFSTYDPSIIACLLKECVAHPRFFKGLRQLDIDGLSFIWPEDEWWWFSGNSWFRFVEIWRLYAMGHNRLAPAYPVPHTLQQLQARRRQRQKQRCFQRSRNAYKAQCMKVKAEKLRQPEDQQHHRRQRHAAPKGKEAARWGEREGVISEISAMAFQGVEKDTEEEESAQGKGTLQSGGRCDDENRNHTSEVTYARGQRYTAGRTSARAELVWRGESAPNCCEGKTFIERQEVSSGWETTRLGGSREAHSSGLGSHSRGRAATERERRRGMWRWLDDWACSSDEEVESQSNEAQALPAGFHGPSSEVDIEGIQRALRRLPRVRKLRLLNFVGETLREPGDSTHILGSFFPEADIEVQGSVLVGRRVLQRLLVKAFYRDTHAAECRKKREWRSIGRATDRETSRRERASGGFDIARSGGAKGIRKWRAERESRASSVRSHFSSEVDEEEYSSDDSACGRLMEFPASPFWASTSRKISSSRSASLVLEGPATISRVEGSRNWRRFIRGALQVSPLGEQYVSRWLRQGLVYKVLMKLAVDWSGRADLRADGFHRECVAVYVSKVLEGLPHWMRKKSVNTKRYRSLRVLELSDCFHKSDKRPEGYIDKRGYFAPFGRAKEVLEYFTPFLLGLDCFYEEVFLPSNTIDDGDDDAGSSVSVGARDENSREEAQASASLEDEDEWVSPGGGNDDIADAEAPQRLDEESGRRFSRAAEGEYTRLLVRRRTTPLDHNLARSVHLVWTSDQNLGEATQRHNLIEKQSDMHDWAAGGAYCGRADRDTRPECPARDSESVSYVLRSVAHEAIAKTGILEGEAREGTEETSPGIFQEEKGESVDDCDGVLSPEREITLGLRSTEEGVAVSAAGGGSHGGRKHTVINDVSERHAGLPDSPRQILHLEGVVGLAMPMYRRFSDFRKQSDLVMTIARAYKAQTRVLLVTDSTLLFYRRCKEFYDNALAALARDFKAVTEECRESLQIIDYRVYRPFAWRCELGDSQDQTCMPSFIRIFLRNNPEFHLARRLDAVRPVDNELAIGLEKVKTTLTAYVWIRKCRSS